MAIDVSNVADLVMMHCLADILLEECLDVSVQSLTVSCPICGDAVAGVRFAPHLEKCMNGGKRGSRKYFDALGDDGLVGFRPQKIKVVLPDPHPDSLVVRIRLKYGAPWGNGRRMGVSLGEFQQSVLDNHNASVTAELVAATAAAGAATEDATLSSEDSLLPPAAEPRRREQVAPRGVEAVSITGREAVALQVCSGGVSATEKKKEQEEQPTVSVGVKRTRNKSGGVALDDGLAGLLSDRTLRSKVVAPDPHPDSLVVRIRMKYGAPWGNLHRTGATLNEFFESTSAAASSAEHTTAESESYF